MTVTEKIMIENSEFEGTLVTLPHSKLILIQSHNGVLGCGYMDMAPAEKLSEALAVVSGVSSFTDMLDARVKRVSSACAALGVTEGMTGCEALLRMK